MALRARIIPTLSSPKVASPWHKVKWAGIRASKLSVDDRRMEGDVYLSSGYGIRLAIEGKPSGWKPLGDLAEIGMPGRLKGIQVSQGHGTPFLAAMTVFDSRPTARKWLSLDRTADAESRFVSSGTILVTCSGTVGRTTLSYKVHEGKLITHDLLRIKAIEASQRGWIYAYLHSKQVKAMATGAHYGQIIKHLEPSHLQALPIPLVKDEVALGFDLRFEKILALRNKSFDDLMAAEARYAKSIGDIKPKSDVTAYGVSASSILGKRRRLDGSYYAPMATAIKESIPNPVPLNKVSTKIWWMGRFKRFYGEGGLPYMSADELFTVNPADTKAILVRDDDGHKDYFVKRGWILMACSGQVYGLNGAAILATEYDERAFFSHDLIRIIPDDKKIRSGYLLIALTHPTLGRPLLIRAAYGTSIPHLDPSDVADFTVARLAPAIESEIADLAESSAAARAMADAMERELSVDADQIISAFIKRPIIQLASETLRTSESPETDKANDIIQQWIASRPRGGDIRSMASAAAYRNIIAMGESMVRPLLLQLSKKPGHWFVALNEITGENPIEPPAEGNVKLMAKAWIKWGKKRGYLSELD